jgi:hypothetical protein
MNGVSSMNHATAEGVTSAGTPAQQVLHGDCHENRWPSEIARCIVRRTRRLSDMEVNQGFAHRRRWEKWVTTMSFEPAFAVEIEWIAPHSLSRLGRPYGESAYPRLSIRPVHQDSTLETMGVLVTGVLAAADWMAQFDFDPEVAVVNSPSRLFEAAQGRRVSAIRRHGSSIMCSLPNRQPPW